MSFFLSDFLQDLTANEPPTTNAAQAAPINDEPSIPPPRPTMSPPTNTPMTDAIEPSTPKHRRKATSNDHEPSPDFASLSRAAKNKFRAIMRKRQGTSSETRVWYCRERCDWPFASQNERSYHERRCAVGLGDRRFSSRQEFEKKIAGRSNEDVLSEWESLMQESARKFSGGGPVAAEGGGAGGGGGGGGKEVEGEVGRQEKVQQQRLADENQALGGGLQHVGGKDTALRKERSSSGVFSTEFILKYGAMQIEEKDARNATFAEFTAKYGAADVEQAEPEVQVKVEDDGNNEIPLGENWWVPQ
ncbi:hypothetical protein DIS24_g10651 [Lasiodiplodia hormozganensis]|uniref:Uncharacterized protein n=1 Tax=Lasiodiplodia hormozganensis TaxID=869390 RepID=A0AA39XQL7_9PEZI|nr:hypothetical protein DIS24_g10651 [Lasiodiplodia hormozganensis]